MLDTHAFLWWLDGDRRLPARVRALIGEPANEVLVSAASVWEITIKARLGKLPRATEVSADVPACIISTVLHKKRGIADQRETSHHEPGESRGIWKRKE